MEENLLRWYSLELVSVEIREEEIVFCSDLSHLPGDVPYYYYSYADLPKYAEILVYCTTRETLLVA